MPPITARRSYPIAYLARMAYYGLGHDSDEWVIATRTAQQYIDAWPYHLADGTYSRKSGWAGQPPDTPTFVWADDAFMGVLPLTQLAAAGYNSSAFIDVAAGMALSYAAHLTDAVTGLYRHGYNDATKEQSCCAWGRANGWQMMSHVEVLAVLPPAHPSYDGVLAVLAAHAKALAGVQNVSDGRWHQVLDDPTTYLETSATAMNLFSMATAVLRGWLQHDEYDATIRAAWRGLAATVGADGVVSGICVGTGVQTSAAQYNERPTTYSESAPGLGAVFRAALAYSAYIGKYGPGA